MHLCYLPTVCLYWSFQEDHYLVSEVRVFVVDQEPFRWFNTVEFWRVVATWAGPACYLLFYFLVAISWAAATRWTDLLYHPPEVKKKKIKTKDGKTKVVEEKVAPETGPFAFDDRAYARRFLERHGIGDEF